MKQIVYLLIVAAGIFASGCASDHHHRHYRGGTYDRYERSTGYDHSRMPQNNPSFQHYDRHGFRTP